MSSAKLQGVDRTGTRLNVKDLISVGIFTTLYFVILMAVGMLGFIPIFIPLLTVLCPLIGGIPFMLFLTKVKKFGMVWIMGILAGILMLMGGMGVWAFPTGILFGLLADLIFKSGGYVSSKKSVIGYGVFSMWLIGNFIPIFVNREGYVNNLISGGFGEEYAATLMGYLPDWSFLPLLAACFVFGVLGALLGRQIMKKHFLRAGIV